MREEKVEDKWGRTRSMHSLVMVAMSFLFNYGTVDCCDSSQKGFTVDMHK